jgi:acyl-CoA dehydrogenase
MATRAARSATSIGEENRGLLCMFTMMNKARLGVGLEGRRHCRPRLSAGTGLAQERTQGRAGSKTAGMDPIIVHPDVKRMLMQMRP